MKKFSLKSMEADDRKLLGNIGLAFLVKGASLFLSIFSMPLYINYFGNNEILGAWYTALSVLSWISMCDLGLGNGLRNRLTEALAKGSPAQAKKYVSSTYCMLTLIILPVLLVGNVAIRFLDLVSFLKLDPNLVSNHTLQNCLMILFSSICLSFVLKTVNMVIYAAQKSSLNNILALITSAIPLCFMALSKYGNLAAKLYDISFVHGIAINAPLLIASLVLYFSKTYRQCRPSIKGIDFSIARQTVGLGLKFFAAQVAFMLLTTTNELIITRFFETSDVVEYSVYFKLFTAVGSLFMLALTPMWSSVTKNLAQGKYEKVRKTNHLLYGIAGFAFLFQFALVPFLQWIINFWLKEDAITVQLSTALVFALFGGLYIFNIVLTTIANGIGQLKTQIVFYGIGAALKFPVMWIITQFTDNWVTSVLYNCAVFGLFCLFQLFWVEKKLKKLN